MNYITQVSAEEFLVTDDQNSGRSRDLHTEQKVLPE